MGLVGSSAETVKMVRTFSPDIVLIDLSHPEKFGLQTVSVLHTVHPHAIIITFMPISSQEYTQASLDAGATACLPKSEMAEQLLPTLRTLGTIHSPLKPN